MFIWNYWIQKCFGPYSLKALKITEQVKSNANVFFPAISDSMEGELPRPVHYKMSLSPTVKQQRLVSPRCVGVKQVYWF